MAAITNFTRLKNHIGIRVLGSFIWLLGLSIYIFLVFVFYLDFSKTDSQGLIDTFWYFIKYVLFAPGVVPLVVSFFYFVLFDTVKKFMMGFVITPTFVFMHYIVSVFSAHANEFIYVALQLIEIICAIFVVKINIKSNPKGSRGEKDKQVARKE